MEHPAAPLLAADLGRLPHTNKHGERNVVHVPGFMSTAGANPEFAEHAGTLALAVAEAVIEDLGQHGFEVIHKSDIQARVAEIATEDTREVLPVVCKRCRQRVHGLDETGNEALVDIPVLLALYEAHMQGCR